MNARTIVEIDEDRCNGCGLCIPNCPEGALRVIDGKARLVGDLFCDGLGACLGYCPEGAIRTVTREAEPYDELRVMENVARQGANTVRAHLEHLRSHGEDKLLAQALAWLRDRGLQAPASIAEDGDGDKEESCGGRCPGSRSIDLAPARPTALANWPVQLHLLSPMAPFLRGSHVLLAADCTAFAMGSFHERFIRGRMVAIACPKLDDGADIYREKIVALVDHAQIKSLTVVMMEVPCCRGLLAIAREAVAQAKRKVPITSTIIGIRQGAVMAEKIVG